MEKFLKRLTRKLQTPPLPLFVFCFKQTCIMRGHCSLLLPGEGTVIIPAKLRRMQPSVRLTDDRSARVNTSLQVFCRRRNLIQRSGNESAL